MIHFMEQIGGIRTTCGIDTRYANTEGQTNHRMAVTCPECQETVTFKRSVQRIPSIPVPVGLKHRG